MTKTRKKLIEVALPLDAINEESLRRKQKAPKGWPTSFHKWWAQRPLAAARAVIFSQMVDDPSACPELFPTEKKQEKERQRLFDIIKELVLWDNTGNEQVLEKARTEIWQSWRRACADNADHPRAKELFNRNVLPAFQDPFAGSGSIPLSAQWLGLKSYASDLNPVAVLINKAMIEIPPRFAGQPPVNPEARASLGHSGSWKGAQGLAEDVRYYGQWMRNEAEKRIGHLYPKVKVTAAMVKERPDLKPYLNDELTVTAWLWTRTVRSPNPAFANVDVPLASTFMLSTKPGKEAYVEPIKEKNGYHFMVKVGKPKDETAAKKGTKVGGSGTSFFCLMSDTPMPFEYLREEAKAGRMNARMLAIVAEGKRGRLYLSPTTEQESIAFSAKPDWKPETSLPGKALGFRVQEYGMTQWSDLFTSRQLVSLTLFSDLIGEAIKQVHEDAIKAGLADDKLPLRVGGVGGQAYAEAVGVYLACVVDRMVYYGSSLTTWLPKDNALRDCMPRQTLQMVWDYAEGNPIGKSSIDVLTCAKAVSSYLDVCTPNSLGVAFQGDARTSTQKDVVISTDPPYYDNIGYADLSDYFYVWLRNSAREIYPDEFATMSVPKVEELIATPFRHGGTEQAKDYFLDGMTHAMHDLAKKAHPGFPIAIYYAFKQSETEDEEGTASTGWETFLAAVINAGLSITGTWPLRTEGAGRMIASGTNALASSIVLVCQPRSSDALVATRREFVSVLKSELPKALVDMQRGNIAPVDLAQASIGPGMAVFTRYAKVLDAQGQPMSVREALALINEVLDEALAEQEGDFDADTRFALAWFEQQGFADGEFGVADVLARAKNTSVTGLMEAGIAKSGRGKVRLLQPEELNADWDPQQDARLTAWEMVHHLVRAQTTGGDAAAAELLAQLGSKGAMARELAYRLYNTCERKKRSKEALWYNSLVQAWPELERLAQEASKRGKLGQQIGAFDNENE